MLSRIAESLYWLGRHAERAESTARILDVYSHAVLEDRRGDEGAACRRLLEAMGAAEYAEEAGSDVERLIGFLADDPRYPGSIVRAVDATWENARGARETISSEMWESINTTHALLDDVRGDGSPFARNRFFGWVRDRVAILAGLTDATMSHDDAWRFIVLGRNIERVDMTVRLLSARLGDAWGPAGWIATLRGCSGYEAFLRTYSGRVDGGRTLEFLLLDRLFPRSVFHALSATEGILFELDPAADRRGATSEARRIVGRACAELEFARPQDLLGTLPQHLAGLERSTADAHHAITSRYFDASIAIKWSPE